MPNDEFCFGFVMFWFADVRLGDLAPEYLSEIFTKNSACSRKNLRNTATDLQVPLMKTCNGQRAFSYRGAGVWNHLDSKVKQASSFKAFKEGLKK